MSVESYSALDESSLRALLDGTLDLDERRLIRSAIRELRRREIEDMEAALASKRFRPTRLKQQEDKENQHRSECSDNLDNLSRKLQSVKDIDELTKMLRAANEYEERKLIRTAIRQIRDEQQQVTVKKVKAPGHCLDLENVETQCNMGAEETESHGEQEIIKSSIRELQQTQQSKDLLKKDSNLGMVLVLDHLVKEEAPRPLLTQSVSVEPNRQRSDSSASDHSVTSRSNLDSEASEKSLGSNFRVRLDSGASDRSQSSLQRARLDSGASEQSTSSQSYIRQRLGSDASNSSGQPHMGSEETDSVVLARVRTDSRGSDVSMSMSSEERSSGEGVDVPMSHSPCSTDSECESRGRESAYLPAQDSQNHISEKDQPDGAVLSKSDPTNDLLIGSTEDKKDSQKQKMTVKDLSVTNDNGKDCGPEKKDAILTRIKSTNSVRDRMRKFTESSQSTNVPPLKKAPLRIGTTSGITGHTSFSRAAGKLTHTVASLNSSGGSSSVTSAASQSQATTLPRGGATPHLSLTGQSQNSLGGTRVPAEKDVPVFSDSKEEDTPGRESGQQVTQGEADTDMKTFLTIEIKDGHTTTNSTSSSRSNIIPITNLTPRINQNAAGQRAELTLGLRATPFKISSSSLSSGSSFKIETEPVTASEPVFLPGSSIQVPCQVPAIPNGSGTQTKLAERSGKLTAEQLATIEDEELLDKMLDETKDFEERKMIRAAMRDLRKRKRDQREKERDARLQELRQQREDRSQKTRAGVGAGEVVKRKIEKSADGSTLSQVTKTDRFAQFGDGNRSTRSTIVEASYVQKTDRGTVQSKSYSFISSSNTTKKVGSVFDREDDTSSRSGGLAAVDRMQAERRKELMRAQTMPKTSAMQARKAMIEKLEKEGGGPGNQSVAKVNRVQRSTSFGVPNANSIKQMLLDWCRAKTRGYEHVDIQNFSSSWSNGMAFCALVHHFFPEAFDYDSLSPSNRRQNFEVAFSTAEREVDCPQLLDVDDMVKMREPDWKCVYTYLQEFYRGLVTKGLVKTKNSS